MDSLHSSLSSSPVLFTKETQCIFYNLKAQPIQLMLDYDFLCKRDLPSIAAIVHPGRKGFHKTFFGEKEILIPIYQTIKEAVQKNPTAEVLMNFASSRSAFFSTREALEMPSLKTAIIVAEGVPERESKELIMLAGKMGKTLIGPATVGGIAAGRFRMGNAGGLNENILKAKLYRPGSVGLVSKSGGMLNELFHIISRATDGIYEGVAIGGDLFPGTTLLDHLLRFEAMPKVLMMVALGELGGKQEYEIIAAKKEGRLTKPLVMYVSGTSANIFPWEVQFGHAGAKASQELESAAAKNLALREAGIIVPESFEDFEQCLADTFKKVQFQTNKTREEKMEFVDEPQIPANRKATHFTTTISSEEGEELSYAGISIRKIIENSETSLGEVLCLLWFKKKLPVSFSRFLEISLMLCADHGPAVSGAHNAIVAARAGKDMVSSLCSGLLTIGPRFGGALDDACRYFKQACDKYTSPGQFVEEMKQKSIPIPGIGHKVKSKRNPDQRVELLKEYARKNFSHGEVFPKYLTYALAVEKITLQKAENLILNVDGCLAAVFLDALENCKNEDGKKYFSEEEIQEIVDIGYLNGLFVLARSIGLIGHIFDQKRLGEGLYRHADEDVGYFMEER